MTRRLCNWVRARLRASLVHLDVHAACAIESPPDLSRRFRVRDRVRVRVRLRLRRSARVRVRDRARVRARV